LLQIAMTILPGGNPAVLVVVRKGAAGLSVAAQASDTGEVAVPEPSALALRYYRTGVPLWVAGTVLDLAIPALLLWSAASARMRTAARRLARGRWYPTVALYGAMYVVLSALLGLPFGWYVGFVRQHAYGLSTQTASQFLGDAAKAAAVGCAAAALTLWIPYLLLRKSPRRWWLWTGLAAAPLATLALVLAPIWVDPLFDRFGPMRDRALETRIVALARRAGIQGGRVYEVAKSEDTRQVNAYVTGLGATKRIVLWDTLVDRLTPDEVVFVMGHEMGHYVLGHTALVILGATLLVTGSMYAVHRVAGALLGRWSRRFGFDRLDDPASLPLLALVAGVVSLAVTPAVLATSRHLEHEADRFGLELTRDNRAAAQAFVKLQQDNLGVPRTGVLDHLWRDSHPDSADRIEFANRYRPWTTGGTLRYRDRVR
jgi:Zn-dependent protease with chaperone function